MLNQLGFDTLAELRAERDRMLKGDTHAVRIEGQVLAWACSMIVDHAVHEKDAADNMRNIEGQLGALHNRIANGRALHGQAESLVIFAESVRHATRQMVDIRVRVERFVEWLAN
jgi:hypothetical protein